MQVRGRRETPNSSKCCIQFEAGFESWFDLRSINLVAYRYPSATSITTEARQVTTVSFFGGERLFRFPPDSQQFDRFPPFIHPADRIRPLDPNFTIAMPSSFIILSSGAGILRQSNLVVKTMSHVEGANEKGTGKTEVRLYVTSDSCQPNFLYISVPPNS